MNHRSRVSGVGLERSCDQSCADWMRSSEADHGVEFLEAWFQGSAYQKHRHDTYAICLTTCGVQAFEYRGVAEISLPGQITVLHPDELHDGHAGSETGFGYKILYVEPALIYEAVRVLSGRGGWLPFVRSPVILSQQLASAITGVFQSTREPLAIDSLMLQLAEGLIAADACAPAVARPRYLDSAALERARQFLDQQKTRVVRSAELEVVTGLSRYELARQFRAMHGTSPYRYLLMRRLAVARQQIAERQPLADVALAAGFADQAHLTRMFKAAFGLTPARYGALRGAERADISAGPSPVEVAEDREGVGMSLMI